jgi:antitoxin component YwqK of YwqJK toxin-antitoxin module
MGLAEAQTASGDSSGPAIQLLNAVASPSSSLSAEPSKAELVIQRFPDGKHQIEREVMLDEAGNYVNHGRYQEWNSKGDLIATGEYANGQQQGLWVRFCSTKDSKVFEQEPYNRFKAPFQSSVEFQDGKLHGIWTITDKEDRTVSQVQFEHGLRSGPAVWFHPSGVPLWQGEYREGLLHGMFVEKDAQGKLLRESMYHSGRRIDKKTEYYAPKKVKSEFEYLTAAQTQKSADDWNRTVLATYELRGAEIKHGPHKTYFENGSPRSVAHYKNGKLTGAFEGWHANGQKEVQGAYEDGVQQGQWSWWHPNGMRRSLVVYHQGSAQGEVLAWNDGGKRVQGNEALVSTPTVPETSTVKAETLQLSRRPGSGRSADGKHRLTSGR